MKVSKRGIPKEVLQPNEEAMEKHQKLAKIKELVKSLE